MAEPTMGEGILEEKTTAQLKKDLQRVIQSIADEDDYSLNATDRAMQTLTCLKELKMKLLNPENVLIRLAPPEFLCYFSGRLMNDPVVIASGQTYDRPSILKWLEDGHGTCPKTKQVLPHMILTPNLLLKEMISSWCKEHGVELSGPLKDVGEAKITVDAYPDYLSSLLEKLSWSVLSDQKMAAKEFRHMTKQSPAFRALFGEVSNAISHLVEPLLSGNTDIDPELQEDLVTTIYHLAVHDNNVKLLADNPAIIPLLIKALKAVSIVTRSSAAGALFFLSDLDSNKKIIGELGALKPLIELLAEGHPLAMEVAALVVYHLCSVPENRRRAVYDGAVGIIMTKIIDQVLMDELLAILELLARHQNAIEEMAERSAVSLLLKIIRENTSDRSKENCIAILYTMCSNDREYLREIRKEDTNGTISQLAQKGSSRAKRKANGILERLK